MGPTSEGTFDRTPSTAKRGVGLWVLRHRFAGKPRWLKLGSYPERGSRTCVSGPPRLASESLTTFVLSLSASAQAPFRYFDANQNGDPTW